MTQLNTVPPPSDVEASELLPTPALAPRTIGQGMIPRTIGEAWTFAVSYSKSDFADGEMKKAESVFVVVVRGAELGLPPMTAVSTIACIKGRATLWGDGMLGVCQRSGLFDFAGFKESYDGKPYDDDFFAFTEVGRISCPNVVRVEYSVADAKAAGLWNKAGTWQTHKKRMLKYRARSFALRQAFADVLMGLYTAEEMIDVEPMRPAFVAPEPTEAEMIKQYRKEPDPPAGGASPDDASAADPGKGVRQAAGQGLCEAPPAGGQTSGPSGGDAERQAAAAETTAAPSGGAATATACGPLRTKVLQLHGDIADQRLADIELGKCGLEDTAEVRSCDNEGTLKEAIEALQHLKLVTVPAKGGGAAGKQGKLV